MPQTTDESETAVKPATNESRAPYTAGPWRMRHAERYTIGSSKSADLFIIDSDSRRDLATIEVPTVRLFERRNYEREVDREKQLAEFRANGALMAAAPDLLAAVNQFLSAVACVDLHNKPGMSVAFDMAVAAKRLALAADPPE